MKTTPRRGSILDAAAVATTGTAAIVDTAGPRPKLGFEPAIVVCLARRPCAYRLTSKQKRFYFGAEALEQMAAQ